MKVTITLENVDWKLLQEQKESLVKHAMDTKESDLRDCLDGVINFLDAIQDAAVNQNQVTEKEVFGIDN